MTSRRPLPTILRRAVVDLVSASAELQALAERVDRLVVAGASIDPKQLPVLVVTLGEAVRVGGIGDRRRVPVLLSAFAEGNDAFDVAEQLLQIAREKLTVPALEAYAINGEPQLSGVLLQQTERQLDSLDLVGELPVQFGRGELELTITATVQPSLVPA